jgi:hypothetical protein
MSEVQRSLPGAWDQSDVTRVLHALRHSGPMPVSELQDHPDLDGWHSDRVYDAVVAAWSHDLISIDPRDLLIVL